MKFTVLYERLSPNHNMPDKISIVIPTYQSPSIHATLEAISKQTALDRVAEVIVAGQQPALECNTLPQLIFLAVNERPTPARNRNAGARQASGDWICFTDSDCLPQPDWIEKMLESIQPAVSVYAGSVDIPSEISYWGYCDHLIGFSQQAAGIARQDVINYAATLNFCIRRELFLKMRGFDEHFATPGGEDRDLCWRLEQAGEKIAFIAQASVIHSHNRLDFRSAWRHNYHYGEVTSRFRLRHSADNSLVWRASRKVAEAPLLGEVSGVLRVLARAFLRPIRQPGILRRLPYWPGMLLLDAAHTYGMINRLRKDGNQDWRRDP
jgi:GT2 family glycosyltransferase